MKEFRQLTVDDAAEYHEVLIAGYAENKNYPISFDAINFSPEESRVWILKYPVFGLYVDGSLYALFHSACLGFSKLRQTYIRTLHTL